MFKNRPSIYIMLITAALIGLFAGLTGSTAFAATLQIKDVPAGHPAYEAVTVLVSKGCLSISQDGSFKGNEPVDRYTLAAALACVIDNAGTSTGSLSDTKMLSQLIDDYHAELVDYYSKQETLTAGLQEEARRTATLTESIGKFLVSVENLTAITDSTQKGLAALSAAISQQQADSVTRNSQLASDLATLSASASANNSRLDALLKQLQADLTALSSAQKKGDDTLRAEAQILVNNAKASLDQSILLLQQRTDNLQVRVTKAETRLDTVDLEAQKLSGRIDTAISDAAVLAGKVAELSNRVDVSVANLTAQIASGDSALSAQIQVINNQLAEASIAIDLLTKDLANLRTTSKQQVDALDAKVTLALANLEAQMKAADQKLQAGLDDQQKQINAIRSDVGDIQVALADELLQLKSDIDSDTTNLSTQFSGMLSSINQRISSGETNLQTLREEHDATAANLKTLATDLQQQKAAAANGDAQLQSAIDAQATAFRTDLQKSEERVNFTLAADKAEWQAALNNMNQTQEQQRAALQQSISQNAGAITQLQSTVDAHDIRLQQIEKAAAQALADSAAGLQKGQDELAANISNVITAQAAALTDHAAKISALQQTTADQASTLAQTNNALQQSTTGWRDITNQHSEALAAQQAGQNDLAADLAAEQAARAADSAALRSEIQALSQQMQTALAAADARHQQQLAEQDQRHAAETEELNARIAALDTELASAKQDISQLRTEITDMQSRANLSKAQFDELERSLRDKLLEEGNKTVSREELLAAQVVKLNESLEQYKEESDAKVSSAKGTAWTLSILATLLGILVARPGL